MLKDKELDTPLKLAVERSALQLRMKFYVAELKIKSSFRYSCVLHFFPLQLFNTNIQYFLYHTTLDLVGLRKVL